MKLWAGIGRADGRPWRDAPEKRVQHVCRQWLALKGYRIWHLSQARASQQSPGLPDDLAVGPRGLVALEYKSARGRQTPYQQAFQAAWEAHGGVYVLAHSLGELIAALEGA